MTAGRPPIYNREYLDKLFAKNMYVCSDCQEEKPLLSMVKQEASLHGYKVLCKECLSERGYAEKSSDTVKIENKLEIAAQSELEKIVKVLDIKNKALAALEDLRDEVEMLQKKREKLMAVIALLKEI